MSSSMARPAKKLPRFCVAVCDLQKTAQYSLPAPDVHRPIISPCFS